MGVKIPNYPWKFESNTLYHDLYDQYIDENTTWNVHDLCEQYPALFIDQILKYKILTPVAEDILEIGFQNDKTTAGKILGFVRQEIRSYLELQKILPKVLTIQESLKHNLSFLCNFKQIQCFNLPTTARTMVTVESNYAIDYDPEEDIDLLYKIGDILEPRFQYRVDLDDGFAPFRSKLV